MKSLYSEPGECVSSTPQVSLVDWSMFRTCPRGGVELGGLPSLSYTPQVSFNPSELDVTGLPVGHALEIVDDIWVVSSKRNQRRSPQKKTRTKQLFSPHRSLGPLPEPCSSGRFRVQRRFHVQWPRTSQESDHPLTGRITVSLTTLFFWLLVKICDLCKVNSMTIAYIWNGYLPIIGGDVQMYSSPMAL